MSRDTRRDVEEIVKWMGTKSRADFDLSFKLVSLRYDVPVPTELDAYQIKPQEQHAAVA